MEFRGFPKLGVPFWGVPVIRAIVFWGSMLVSPYFRNLPFVGCTKLVEKTDCTDSLTGVGHEMV